MINLKWLFIKPKNPCKSLDECIAIPACKGRHSDQCEIFKKYYVQLKEREKITDFIASIWAYSIMLFLICIALLTFYVFSLGLAQFGTNIKTWFFNG